MEQPHIMVLGIGNILFSDEGFGVRVIEKLRAAYEFPDNVSVVDGGVLGVNLLGVISRADHLIVVDAVRNKQPAGAFYRLEGEEIPERVRAKNSLHQIDFLEALTMCQALDKVPRTVILGVEPLDMQTLSVDMTPTIQAAVDPMIQKILHELDRLNVSHKQKGDGAHVPCHTFEDCQY